MIDHERLLLQDRKGRLLLIGRLDPGTPSPQAMRCYRPVGSSPMAARGTSLHCQQRGEASEAAPGLHWVKNDYHVRALGVHALH